jgi:hypothetical protein
MIDGSSLHSFAIDHITSHSQLIRRRIKLITQEKKFSLRERARADKLAHRLTTSCVRTTRALEGDRGEKNCAQQREKNISSQSNKLLTSASITFI